MWMICLMTCTVSHLRPWHSPYNNNSYESWCTNPLDIREAINQPKIWVLRTLWEAYRVHVEGILVWDEFIFFWCFFFFFLSLCSGDWYIYILVLWLCFVLLFYEKGDSHFVISLLFVKYEHKYMKKKSWSAAKYSEV